MVQSSPSVYIIRAPCEYAPDGWWLTNPTGAEAGWSNESQLELYALTYTLDVTFDNVDDAIAAAELLSARFKRDIPVKVG